MKIPALTVILVILFAVSACRPGEEIILKSKTGKAIIDYRHLAVDLVANGNDTLQVSAPEENVTARIEKQSGEEAVILYPQLKKRLTFRMNGPSLEINVESFENDDFTWPVLAKFDALVVPFHQGKYIPAADSTWVSYLDGRDYTALEALSMQFLAPVTGSRAAVFIIVNPFNNEIRFKKHSDHLGLAFNHEFPATVEKREYGFIVTPVDNSPAMIAGTYRDYVSRTGGITTLEEKAAVNPNIRELYGAAFYYLWSQEFLCDENLDAEGLAQFWKAQLEKPGPNPTKHLFVLFGKSASEGGNGLLNEWENIAAARHLNTWQKGLIVRSLNEVLSYRDFYDEASWRNVPHARPVPGGVDIEHLNETGLYQVNKSAFYAAFRGYTQTIDHWGNGVSTDMLNSMKNAGIRNAWLGLNEWKPALINPGFVKQATDMGYLVGPYDSYHCIHEPGNEQWTTAAFEDTTLYRTATVTRKNGKKAAGFLGVGRKLNPTLSLPAVENRVEGILDQGIAFNSWFVDCDGTGEFLDDYTPERMTSQEDDMNARLKRMSWLANDKKMVVGTEVGNDFCAGTIAYAHGMTTPVIEWSDPDMRKNKDSKYYTGSYYSPGGGVPPKFGREIPVKALYRYVYLDPRFDLPLFQLVYNNSVITSHHWEWGTLKIPSLRRERELQEILYNVPPLYHLDRKEWVKNKDLIIPHVLEFYKVHSKAVKMEMLSVEFPSGSREIQVTRFGQNHRVSLEMTANFSSEPYHWKTWDIPPKAILIRDLDDKTSRIYVPE